jgi:hypothetical protein
MLLEIVQNDGLLPKRKTATEYGSACPDCGGNDRFVIHIDSNKFWCRVCGIKGDAIQYMRDFHGMSFADAAEQVGKEIIYSDRVVIPSAIIPKKEQPAEWRNAAKNLIAHSTKNIENSANVLAWLLRERGITEHTARAFSLGWLSQNIYQEKTVWGLPHDGKKLFIPSGLVIGQENRIKIRRDNPGEYGRYHVVSGSTAEPLTIGTPYETTAIIVESELDAILLSQEVKRKLFIVALGSSSIKPDEALINALLSCPVVLIALDTDKAGGKAAEWWIDNISNAYRTLTPKSYGKDTTEAFLNGLNLNTWLSASMQLACEK